MDQDAGILGSDMSAVAPARFDHPNHANCLLNPSLEEFWRNPNVKLRTGRSFLIVKDLRRKGG